MRLDLNSKDFENFDLMLDKEDRGVKCLVNRRDVTTLPPSRNLVLRFEGEENLRSKNRYMVH
jgi:hypothetical protein